MLTANDIDEIRKLIESSELRILAKTKEYVDSSEQRVVVSTKQYVDSAEVKILAKTKQYVDSLENALLNSLVTTEDHQNLKKRVEVLEKN